MYTILELENSRLARQIHATVIHMNVSEQIVTPNEDELFILFGKLG